MGCNESRTVLQEKCITAMLILPAQQFEALEDETLNNWVTFT